MTNPTRSEFGSKMLKPISIKAKPVPMKNRKKPIPLARAYAKCLRIVGASRRPLDRSVRAINHPNQPATIKLGRTMGSKLRSAVRRCKSRHHQTQPTNTTAMTQNAKRHALVSLSDFTPKSLPCPGEKPKSSNDPTTGFWEGQSEIGFLEIRAKFIVDGAEPSCSRPS